MVSALRMIPSVLRWMPQLWGSMVHYSIGLFQTQNANSYSPSQTSLEGKNCDLLISVLWVEQCLCSKLAIMYIQFKLRDKTRTVYPSQTSLPCFPIGDIDTIIFAHIQIRTLNPKVIVDVFSPLLPHI